MLSDNYASIESQILTINQSFSGNGNDPDAVEITVSETPTGDLDRNELAELLYVRLIYTLSIRNLDQAQTEEGNARGDFKVRINDPASADTPDDTEAVVLDGNPTVTRQVGNALNDAANELFRGNVVVAPLFQDDATGVGGGGDTGETAIVETDFMSMGGGPVLDRFDDIKIESSVNSSNIVDEVHNEARLQLYYRVDDFEDRGIQSFGRP
jgi:hypothetical protein